MEEFIMKYWAQLLALILSTAWLTRLESKVKGSEKDITELKTDNKEEIKKINTKLDLVNDSIMKMSNGLSELTGYLKGKECK